MRRWAILLCGLLFFVTSLPAHAAPSAQTGDDCKELNQAGMPLYRQTKYLEALEQFEQAHTCYQEIGDRRDEGIILNNIGLVYDNPGQYEQALILRRELE